MRTNPENADQLRYTAEREPFVGAYRYDDPPPSDNLYFVKSASGHCKIGRSGDVQARLKSLRTASPFPLELVLILNGHGWQEPVWHAAFAHQRVHLEWFQWGGGLLRAIVAARRGDEWIATLAPPAGHRPPADVMTPWLVDQSPQAIAEFSWRNHIASLEDDTAAEAWDKFRNLSPNLGGGR